MNAASAQPTQPPVGTLPLIDNLDVVTCRKTVREITAALNFSAVGQTMLVTAASELARNTLVHGGGGKFSWKIVSGGARQGLTLTFEDEGPGIPDMQFAMTNGWSSGKGLGLGLPGAKRLVNEFDIETIVGRGTRVVVTRWR
jgi:serine/threonine-protein kinase RsbT